MAAFFGHDHVNDFDGKIIGIRLIRTRGAGFTTYGAERGVCMITLLGNRLPDFETKMLNFSRLIDKDALPAD